jgi:hypothetical protein
LTRQRTAGRQGGLPICAEHAMREGFKVSQQQFPEVECYWCCQDDDPTRLLQVPPTLSPSALRTRRWRERHKGLCR